jgi:XTP/dITP diphosphohydrolase
MKLLIASNNQGKVRELAELLEGFKVSILKAGDFPYPEPEENGLTFTENAKIKSDYYYNLTGITSLADDSGLCVDALNGAPGIYSARWAGAEKDFSKAISLVEQELIEKTGTNKNHKAHFICVLSISFGKGKSVQFEGRIDGTLTFPAKGSNGFGYDPIFIPNGGKKTYGEISQKEKNQNNHRSIAFLKFKDWFLKTYA